MKQQIFRDLVIGCDANPHEYGLVRYTSYALGLSPRESLESNWNRYKKLMDKRSIAEERYGFIRFFEGYNPTRKINSKFEEMKKDLSKLQLEIRVEQNGSILIKQISQRSLSAVIPKNQRKPLDQMKPSDLKDHLITMGEEIIVSEGCLIVCGYDYYFEIGRTIDPDAEISAEQRWRTLHDTRVVSLEKLGHS